MVLLHTSHFQGAVPANTFQFRHFMVMTEIHIVKLYLAPSCKEICFKCSHLDSQWWFSHELLLQLNSCEKVQIVCGRLSYGLRHWVFKCNLCPICCCCATAKFKLQAQNNTNYKSIIRVSLWLQIEDIEIMGWCDF